MRKDIQDIMAFIAVARERSFTRAAARMGTSQSALSHTIRGLESRLGVRLLTRTTRSVAPTEAGERLLQTVAPRLDEIEAEMDALGELREKPAGSLRITTAEHAANTIIWPALERFLPQYPDISVEVAVNYGLVDIVAERFDIGIRLGEQVARDMIAVPIGPEVRMAVVGSPAYFAKRKKPKTIEDLPDHNCINLRLPTHGGLMQWDFEKDGREVKVRVEGQVTATSGTQVMDAALRGLGLGWVPEDMVLGHIADGTLVRVLDKWCQPFPGYHLYYPNRRQGAPALTALVEALRYRAPTGRASR
ncbi:LysR family transcriptional regulator [Luteibacter aegosomatissinici]|uniref:LysR family transcriptional regulator n=1 Tax=Luteibacter aegosomatissinici TaxID=2911539 RepID=UPI001FF847A7|nr:LysR family transcriptional regulator [Luteibacter aegosomatissinici]UPG93842.1 LysR family transcriptional regulator [Luteibacter aegosomatissinici]